MSIGRHDLAQRRLLGVITRAWATQPPTGWSQYQPVANRQHETAAVLRRVAGAGTRRAMIADVQRIIEALKGRKHAGKSESESAWPAGFLESLKNHLETLLPGSYTRLFAAELAQAGDQSWRRELVNRLPGHDLILDDRFLDQASALFLTALADEWERIGRRLDDGRRVGATAPLPVREAGR